jgi:hypothetical protein
MEKLDTFTRQYLETALWSSTDCDESCTPLDKNYTIDDLSVSAVNCATVDCDQFREKAGSLLDGIDDSQAGHDFWLTRNRHGAGFWDRGLGEVGEQLTKIAQQLGSVDLYVGDDGKIHEA